MTFEEYLEKNEKSQNVSGEAALDDYALNAVAGGVGDVNVDANVETKVMKKDINSNTVLEQIDDHSDYSVIEKFVETKGDIVARGGISF